MVEFSKDYRKDPQVITEYLEGAWKRIELARRFGPNAERVAQMAQQLPIEQQREFTELANMIIGPKVKTSVENWHNVMLERSRNELARIYMPLSALSNMFQGVYGGTVRAGVMPVVKALGSYKNIESQEFLRKTGAVINMLDSAYTEFSGNAKFFLNTRFTQSEQFSRTIAGLSGKYYLEDLYRLAQTGRKDAIIEIGKLGLNAKRILQKGLTEDDLLKAAVKIIHETQFRFAPESMPILAQSALGRLLYTMQSFNINQFNFFRKYILKEAVENKNYWPMVRLFGMGQLIGGSNKLTWAAITGDKDKADLTNMFQNAMWSGGLGILGDIIQGSGRIAAFPIGGVIGGFTADVTSALSQPYEFIKHMIQGKQKEAIGDIRTFGRVVGRRAVVPAVASLAPKQVALPLTVGTRIAIEQLFKQPKGKQKSKKKSLF